ncbi:hypothetical protein OBBRIDRAFT_731072, partial [Obba rivulosa]
GRAYKFYTILVFPNPCTWGIEKLCVELFNYCFLLDFQMRTREKLWSYQKEKSVCRYIHEFRNPISTG